MSCDLVLQGRERLQQHVAELDEEGGRLMQCHFEAEQELRVLEHSLEERTNQNKQLQEDCMGLTEKISSISKGER
jgi:septal ring factor EnvC (AmiA/AmiB activator)